MVRRVTALRRYIEEGYVYHVSSTTHERRPVFRSEAAAKILLEAIDFQRTERAMVLAFVVMPDHFHLLVVPRLPWTISRIMQSIKGYTSRELNEAAGMRGRLWQPSFYDKVIRSESQLWACIEYIHENPVKAGLSCEAEGYPYSSAYARRETDIEKFVGG
jgi:putative transposase